MLTHSLQVQITRPKCQARPERVLPGVCCALAASQPTLATLRRPGVWPPPPFSGDFGGPDYGWNTLRLPDPVFDRCPLPPANARVLPRGNVGSGWTRGDPGETGQA